MSETLTETELASVEARLAAVDRRVLPMAAAIFLDDSVPALCRSLRAAWAENERHAALARELAIIVDVGTCDDPGTALNKVRRLRNAAASAMRDKCVEKVRELAGKFERESFAEAGNQRLIDKTRVDTALAIAAALEALTLEEKQQS